MGDRGHNAGGFAWMQWVQCTECGCKFPIGQRNPRRVCSNRAKCAARKTKRASAQRKSALAAHAKIVGTGKTKQSQGQKETSQAKKLREEIETGVKFVTCPECGNEQGDMGRNVRCEECDFGPMPYYDDKGVLHD